MISTPQYYSWGLERTLNGTAYNLVPLIDNHGVVLLDNRARSLPLELQLIEDVSLVDWELWS